QAAQENEDHEHDQRQRNQQGHFDIAHGGADRGRRIEHHRELNDRRKRGAQRRQQIENAIHGFDDIGARFAIDNQQDGGLAVSEPAGAKIFYGIGYGGDIADAHGGAILITDEQRPVRFRFEYLISGANGPSRR